MQQIVRQALQDMLQDSCVLYTAVPVGIPTVHNGNTVHIMAIRRVQARTAVPVHRTGCRILYESYLLRSSLQGLVATVRVLATTSYYS